DAPPVSLPVPRLGGARAPGAALRDTTLSTSSSGTGLIWLRFPPLCVAEPNPRKDFQLAPTARAPRKVAANALAAPFWQAVEEVADGLPVHRLAGKRVRRTDR